MGCNCGGKKTVSAPVMYEVVTGGGSAGTRTVLYRSPSQARTEAAKTGGQVWRVQDGTRRRI